MTKHHVIPHDDPNYWAIRRRMIITWGKTAFGYAIMLALIALGLHFFGFHIQITSVWGAITTFLPVVLPIVMWWFSAKIALWQTKSAPADPSNPEHQRLIAIVDRLFPKTDLSYKPPVYVSADDRPNAFATGPIHRRAVVAATQGLFKCGMTDAELEAVFAHELGHVRNYDVGLNSMLAVLSAIFGMIVDGVWRLFQGLIGFFKRMFGIKPTRQLLPSIVGSILSYIVFWIVGQVTQLIQFFVVRSRESGADATGAYFTGNPCALATGLQKLVAYAEKHRPKTQREMAFYRAFRPIMLIDPLYDSLAEEPKSDNGIFSSFKKWWNNLHLTHPAVPDRVRELERMNGGKCPTVA